jgi:hypothetical protein
MAGLDPAIQTVWRQVAAALSDEHNASSIGAWMAGSSPAMTERAIATDRQGRVRKEDRHGGRRRV